MEYMIVKTLHILSSTILFGTGIGSAFYMLRACLTARREPPMAPAAAMVVGHVVQADLWFTTSTIIFQPLSGWYLTHLAGIPLTSRWLMITYALYLLAGACWLPVVWIQLRMRDMAREAVAAGRPLPPRFWQYFGVWVALGIPAFFALVVVFYLMVAKPV
ncbi:DUF2269 family protein [Rhizobacter sp. LjRoot28]|jgi:uncharacterized membrane protein|uniref:DUF2269 family protein n=1 Tax=Rhizobacter sp. LjRoot28 TaxID=3342309 RepID=UPI003ED10E1E